MNGFVDETRRNCGGRVRCGAMCSDGRLDGRLDRFPVAAMDTSTANDRAAYVFLGVYDSSSDVVPVNRKTR